MAQSFTIKTNLPDVLARLKAKGKSVSDIFRRPTLQKAISSYLTKTTTKFIQTMGKVGDAPGSVTARGVTWDGFMMRRVTKYGQTVMEGTRSRWRGRKLGAVRGKAKERKAKAEYGYSTAGLGRMTTLSALEKVWNKRASGRRYSETSQMMQDEGFRDGILAAVSLVRITTSGSAAMTVLTFSVGSDLKHLAVQQKRRPIWFIDPATDNPLITALVSREIEQVLR